MIHSCAGGNLKEIENLSFAKVKIENDNGNQFFWCKYSGYKLNVGEQVKILLNNKEVCATVVKVVFSFENSVSPVPKKMLKEIIEKL